MAGERGGNSAYKKGIIRENDPKKGRSKVEFVDEDGTTSYYMRWNMPAAGKSKIFNQPDIGSQVNCVVDHNGEDGVIIGASYSEGDAPPTEDGSLMKMALEGGLDFDYDKGSGKVVIKAPGGFIIEVGGTRFELSPGGLKMVASDYQFD